MLVLLRWVLAGLLFIGLPLFIYLGFIRDEPVLEVEYDVDLGTARPASSRSC